MRAISVRQPWAWAILRAGKNIENRTWKHDYLGQIAIHASLRHDTTGEAYLNEIGVAQPHPMSLVYGVVIGIVTVTDCVPVDKVDSQSRRWAFGPWCWVLQNPIAISPISCRGKLGLFEIDDSVFAPTPPAPSPARPQPA